MVILLEAFIMKEVCYFITVILLEIILATCSSLSLGPMTSVVNVFSQCDSKSDGEWSKKVTISGKRDMEPKNSAGIISWILDSPARITERITDKINKLTEAACSVIPEPIHIPDVHISKLLSLEATNGRISGIQQLCMKLPLTLKPFKRGPRYGFRDELDFSGLHFQYHVVDKLLHVDRTFNWTLAKGSHLSMNLLVELAFPCPVKVEDIDLQLHFPGGKSCEGDCRTVLFKLQCYLYHSLLGAIDILTEPFKQVIKRTLCVSFKQMGIHG